jgi:hypothetical protein
MSNPDAKFAFKQRYPEAIPEYETAIAFNRNWVNLLGPSANANFSRGR